MGYYPASLTGLIENFAKLPGVGFKTAERLAMHILKMPYNEASYFSESIIEVKKKIRFCAECFCLSDNEICAICANPLRNNSTLCIVEQPADMIVIEKSGAFKGLYHILGGALSPMDGIMPNDIKIKEIIARIDKNKIVEVIIATNTNAEGESTADYIATILKSKKIKISRIASGIPVGGELKYIDQVTIKKALDARYVID
ncbi:MAG: recombination protein RecR [Deltaproteobacteria bacterium]|nr:recombination protein RecR [Deltaproteobacteria bacterium]